jgi:SAM-dependent methyltransferase
MSKEYYTGKSGKAYFSQRKSKTSKAQAESAKIFSRYIGTGKTVLDFGCGTGGIISNIDCSRRIGVEINEQATKAAITNRVEVYKNLSDVPDRIADVLISHHAMEHLFRPFDTLLELSQKLKPNGKIIIVVPAENPHTKRNRRWQPNVEKHLFSWNPLTLGNLLEEAGYQIDDSFVAPAGYSHYIEWARPISWLFNLLKFGVAYTLGRFNTVCIASAK